MTDVFPLLGDWRETGQQAACVILTDTKNRLLLQLRDTDRDTLSPGHWGIFGGRMEPGETPRQTALREIHEEIGVTLNPAQMSPLARTQSPFGTRLFAFVSTQTIAPDEITLGEGAGFAFLTPPQLETMPMLPAVSTILHHFFATTPQ